MPTAARAVDLSPLEQASGIVLGSVSAVAAGDGLLLEERPEVTLQRVVRDLVGDARCFVSFSGGQDSSAVLAIATQMARDGGLPLPIPITLRFPGHRDADEDAWQERVVRHLKLPDWERLEVGGELEVLGSIAREAAGTFGLLWPANAHFHVPIFRAARGGVVLTGIDGDALFGDWRWYWAQQVLHGRQRPRPRDVLRVGLALSPTWVRRVILSRRSAGVPPWLRPDASKAVAAALAVDAAGEPPRWDRRMVWLARRRYLAVATHSLQLLAVAAGARAAHPMVDERFLRSLALHRRRIGYASRQEAMQDLFGKSLPAEVLRRRTKAEFTAPLWGEETRAWAGAWSGDGVDTDLIDTEILRDAWASTFPPLASATVLQATWLSQQGHR